MSFLPVLTKTQKVEMSKVRSISIVGRLPQYIFYAGLGVLAGAVGVMVALGLAIIVQLFLFSTTIFAPAALPIALAAVVIGWGVAWLFNHIAPYLFPTLAANATPQTFQMMLIFSTLTSLLQAFLYMQGL